MGIEKIASVALKAGRSFGKKEKQLAKLVTNLADDTANIAKKEKIGERIISIKTKSGKMLNLRLETGREKNVEGIFSSLADKFLTKQLPQKKNFGEFISLTQKEVNELRKFNSLISDNAMMNIAKHMKGKSVQSLTENFVGKKEKLIQEFAKLGNNELLARLKTAKTPEQMTKILFEEEFAGFAKLDKIVSKAGLKNSTLELEQLAHSTKESRAKFIMAREKAMHIPSTNTQVIAIENILKEQYGVKFASLKDDVNMARQVLRAYEVAAKNGVKLPKNVVVSDFMFANGEHLNDTILLASQQSKAMSGIITKSVVQELPRAKYNAFVAGVSRLPNTSQMSTLSEYHVPLHEIMHGEHSPLIAFSMKKIPARLDDVKNNVSAYSALSSTHETFTELNTKRLIDGLNPQEQELYNYLNIFC